MSEASAAEELDGSLEELERLCADQGRIAEGLVLLAEYPVDSLRAELAKAEELLCRRHPASVARAVEEARRSRGRILRLGPESVRDHPWFELSVRELAGYLDCVARDPHGGNRQALGQYWRLLIEAVARHAAEERESLHGLPPRAGVAHRRY
jgi:hypothetical protein